MTSFCAEFILLGVLVFSLFLNTIYGSVEFTFLWLDIKNKNKLKMYDKHLQNIGDSFQ